MTTVSALWVGGPLGFVQKLCLSSFVYHGHTINLYVYDMDMQVPQGVNKLDASDIIPESKVFIHHGQYAGFSDYFRYKMIQRTGTMWVDTDTLCLTENFFEDTDFVFIQESEALIAGSILKMPQSHKITKALLDQTERLIPKLKEFSDNAGWGIIGPRLLTKMVKRFHLEAYAQPAAKVNVIGHWNNSDDYWNPDKATEILQLCKDASCATFFTGALRMKKFDTEQIPPAGSAIEHFAKKFGTL